MYFRITADAAELVEPEDVTSFSAVCPADLDQDHLAASIRRAGLGELLSDGAHVMVPVEAIRRMAAGRVGAQWPLDLAKMLDYAAGKGWTSENGTLVRAHVDRQR